MQIGHVDVLRYRSRLTSNWEGRLGSGLIPRVNGEEFYKTGRK